MNYAIFLNKWSKFLSPHMFDEFKRDLNLLLDNKTLQVEKQTTLFPRGEGG